MADQHREERESVSQLTPRRTLIRSLVSAVVGVVSLGVLAACGGGDDGENEDSEDEDD
jgi:hypothetical protein